MILHKLGTFHRSGIFTLHSTKLCLLMQQRANISRGAVSSTKYFMLTYNYVPDVVNKRAPLRAEHLALAGKYVSEGKVLLGGAFADPVDSAAIIFKTESKADVENFVKEDPYVQKGIVTKWTIRDWTVVVGSLAKLE